MSCNATGQHTDARGELQRRRHQFVTVLAAARQRGPKDFGNRHAEERVRAVRPVVDVLLEGKAFARRTTPVPHERNRIDLDPQCSGAAVVACLGIEHARLTERQRIRLQLRGVLVQEVAQVGRRFPPVRDRQQHEFWP